MKLALQPGTTSKLLRIFVLDGSATDGSGLTGLAWNTSGLAWYYIREGAASATQVTLATMTVGTWASGGFKEIDSTNLPGVYEIGVPNAALAAGANSVAMMLQGATDMAPVPIEIQLEGQHLETWKTGDGAQTVTLTVNDDAATGINGARVGVGTVSGGPYTSTQATTDTNGDAVLLLDDGTYYVKVTASGYTLAEQTLTVSGTTTDTYAMTPLTAPAAGADPDATRVFTYVEDETGTVLGSGEGKMDLVSTKPGIVSGATRLTSADALTSRDTDGAGLTYLDLVIGLTVVIEVGSDLTSERRQYKGVVPSVDGGTVSLAVLVSTHSWSEL